ncbi:hypothetical protein KJ866_03270 [Patescibacteria group bacterium]|nr:hypothetical protein [Patescibacteria group bacterium]
MKKKQELVTKEYLDKTLDKRFSEQAKVIIEAVSEAIDNLSVENKKEHQRLEKKMDDNWNNMEKYIKAQEAFKQEFVIMKEEIKLIKTVIKEKLGVEIRAI